MLNRLATMNAFRECWLVIGRGGRLPRKNLIKASIQAIETRAMQSKERHLIRRALLQVEADGCRALHPWDSADQDRSLAGHIIRLKNSN